MGARTDAARAEVLAARGEVAEELERLEAAARAAVDIPSKAKRAPAKTAALAAGTAFLVAGGPARLLRRVKRVVMGPEADRPKSMLPDEVDKELRKLGDDGERVRATIEREFAKYLDEHREERDKRDPSAVAALLLATIGKPVAERAARRLAEQLFSPERAGFQEAVERIRARRGETAVDRGGPEAGNGRPPRGPEQRRRR